MTMFDPFRFMLRQAYAEGTDLRMFVTPVHAVVRTLQQALGLGERYEFWLRELVRINEEEAVARRQAAAAAVGFQRRQYDHAGTDSPVDRLHSRCDGSGSIRTTARSPAI